MHRRLVSDGILSQAFSVAPVRLPLPFPPLPSAVRCPAPSPFLLPPAPQEYRLVVVGHSLGAGAAALLAFMLRSSYPHVRCYAFSPPRGLLRYCAHAWDRLWAGPGEGWSPGGDFTSRPQKLVFRVLLSWSQTEQPFTGLSGHGVAFLNETMLSDGQQCIHFGRTT